MEKVNGRQKNGARNEAQPVGKRKYHYPKDVNSLIKNKACDYLHKYLKKNLSEKIRVKIQNGSISEEDLLDSIVHNMAWDAMMAHEKYESKSAVKANRKDIEKCLIWELMNNCATIIGDYDAWHNRMCMRFNTVMRYGLWQKLINITFKYIYSLNLCYDYFTRFEEVFPHLHCPVDSKISKKMLCISYAPGVNIVANQKELLYRLSKSQNGGWNGISSRNYQTFQKAADIICRWMGLKSKLEVDVLFF